MPPDPDETIDDRDELSIRGEYEAHGVEGYYREFGRDYRNPHEPIVRRSLEIAAEKWPLGLSLVLDLAAGSGEATLVLRELGAGRVEGIDPFTAEAYQARTGSAAERFTFEQIAGGAIAGRTYSLVVCSFGLHLCEPSRLPGVAWALSLISPELLVLTPHKRPVLRHEWGWALVEEMVVERVRTRLYRRSR
jgi:SAM-dependent methyltransferase